jgi:peptidyl-prolyl cis-trans isomerase A (cyclophilin A)
MAPRNKALRKKARPQPSSPKGKSNKSMILAIAIVALVVIIFGVLVVTGQLNQQPAQTIQPTKVLLETTAGNITIDLRTDKPITSTNFINLANEGKYDGCTFHRTMANFMIQAGRVNGSVATISDEIGSDNHNIPYSVAMANTGAANSASSEFFINVATNSYLDSKYTVFGTVVEGKDVVDAIATAPVIANPDMPGEMSLPVNPVVILHATIVP